MDSLQVVVVASPFSNLTSVYEVDPDADVLLIVPPSTSAIAPLNKPHVNGFKAPANGASPASRLGLRIKVSSKHLALATPVFKTKLQAGNSRTTKQSDGRTHLQLAEGFDPTAVTIVMNAIHGRGSKIPKSVDIKTLAQIALLVDRFQLFDVLEVYAERWIWKLEDTIPHAYGEDLVRWVYASHIFRHATVFKTVTEIAATQSSGPIDTFGLPIREKIIKNIDTARQTLLTSAFTLLHQALDDLASSSPAPTQPFDTLLLGSLIQSLHQHHLVWPRPANPFLNVSFASLVEAVNRSLAVAQKHGRNLQKGGVSRVKRREHEGRAKKEKPAARPAWGVVGGTFPLTPEASPEPSFIDDEFEVEYGNTAVVERLEKLERLGEEVEGLELESGLGYQLY